MAKKKNSSLKFFLLVMLGWGIVVFLFLNHDNSIKGENYNIVEKKEAAFFDVYLLEDSSYYYMTFNALGKKLDKIDNIQSAISKKNQYNLLMDYSKIGAFTPALVENPERFLVIGMGGGNLPSYWLNKLDNIKIDSVEISPEVYELAQKYFGVKKSESHKIHITDGRKYVRNYKGDKYDVVFLDAYSNSGFVPIHLISKEFYQQVGNVMAENGILGINIHVLDNSKKEYLKRMLATIKSSFKNILVYGTEKNVEGNKVVFASNSKKAFDIKELENKFIEIKNNKFNNLKKLPQDYFLQDLSELEKVEIYTDDNATIAGD